MDLVVVSPSQLSAIIDASVAQAVSAHAEAKEAVPPAPKEWLTNTEAMEYLGLSRATLSRYRASRLLPYSKIGSNIYYRLDDIHEMLELGGIGGSE